MSAATASSEIDMRRSFGHGWSAIAALFVLTVRQHTHGRRLFVLGLLYLLPCALAILLRNIPKPADAESLEFALAFNLLPHGLAPLTALLYAAGVIQDEVEEQTLTYLLLRSVPRWALYLTKLLATLCVTSVLIAVATVALYLSIYWGTPQLWSVIVPTRLLYVVGIWTLAQLGYCALFGFIGLLTRRSLIGGVIYIVAIECILANINFVARSLTVVYYVRILLLRWLDWPADILRRFQRDWSIDLEAAPTAEQCVQRLVLSSVLLALLTALWFARREFRLKTPEG